MAARTELTYGGAVAITTSDSVIQTYSGIYVGGAGDVAVVMEGGGAAVTFKAPPVGTVLPIRVSKVMATNTTATLLLGLS